MEFYFVSRVGRLSPPPFGNVDNHVQVRIRRTEYAKSRWPRPRIVLQLASDGQHRLRTIDLHGARRAEETAGRMQRLPRFHFWQEAIAACPRRNPTSCYVGCRQFSLGFSCYNLFSRVVGLLAATSRPFARLARIINDLEETNFTVQIDTPRFPLRQTAVLRQTHLRSVECRDSGERCPRMTARRKGLGGPAGKKSKQHQDRPHATNHRQAIAAPHGLVIVLEWCQHRWKRVV